MWIFSSQLKYTRHFVTFTSEKCLTVGPAWLCFFLGLEHSCCLGSSVLSARAPVTSLCCWTHLCPNLTPTGRSHHSTAFSDLVFLKVPYSILIFKWQFGWGIVRWKSFVMRILKTWLCSFLTLQVAIVWHHVIMILCLKSVFHLWKLIFSLQFSEISQHWALM